jgi:hypothetical protein
VIVATKSSVALRHAAMYSALLAATARACSMPHAPAQWQRRPQPHAQCRGGGRGGPIAPRRPSRAGGPSPVGFVPHAGARASWHRSRGCSRSSSLSGTSLRTWRSAAAAAAFSAMSAAATSPATAPPHAPLCELRVVARAHVHASLRPPSDLVVCALKSKKEDRARRRVETKGQGEIFRTRSCVRAQHPHGNRSACC